VNSDIGRDTGEYRVAPPPEISPAVPVDDGLEISAVGGTPGSTYKSVSPREEHARAASSIANAVPLEPNFRQSNRVLLGLLIVITIAAIILFIAIRTDLPERAFAIVQPATLTPTITNPVVTHTPNTQEQISTGAAVIQTTLTTEIAIPPTSTPTPSISPTTTSTPTQTPSPTVSPSPIPTSKGGGQGEIAYASDRRGIPQIFLVEIDTGRTRQLTNIPEGACQPSWSPDGVFLLFISPCAKNQEEYPGSALFMIEVDQLNPEPMPLPHIPGGDYDPDWSPDGKNIAFTSHQKAGYPRIYIMDVEDQTMTLLSDKFSREKQPVWSSDGKMIAYLTAPNGVNEIWVMNADGSNKTRFTKSTDANNLYPDWSPGEDIILFTQYKPSKQVPGLVAGYYDEGDYTEFPINVGPLPMREAKYSPDGVWIVFEGWPRAGNHEIIIMTTNGANLQQITNLPSFDFDPTWRPAVLEPTP
jgi:Tol biopolymer transport system component